ncbi:hypothetical protein L1987_74632 [Smallanthus sonchifolius]|uniref:Uncharacterized protein n=1 Tax=Smallanthus sonchifolius TaxID=185202 RepID=A0ACB9A3K9_9ASTR|nr:hypothetical protein L1987_74632 [Smallanthus sonchifolius]
MLEKFKPGNLYTITLSSASKTQNHAHLAYFTGSSSNKGAIIGVVVGGVSGLIILLIVVLLWYCRSKRKAPGGSLRGATELQGPKDFSYSDLKKATSDFRDENKLGEGGFGDVYKAILDDEEVVAVKKLKVGNERAKVGFENEILLISNIHHRNLLRLLGWSSEGSDLLLVLEYMPNGSLDGFLWGATPHRNMFYMVFYQIRLTLSALVLCS